LRHYVDQRKPCHACCCWATCPTTRVSAQAPRIFVVYDSQGNDVTGDIITKVSGAPVTSPHQLSTAVCAARAQARFAQNRTRHSAPREHACNVWTRSKEGVRAAGYSRMTHLSCRLTVRTGGTSVDGLGFGGWRLSDPGCSLALSAQASAVNHTALCLGFGGRGLSLTPGLPLLFIQRPGHGGGYISHAAEGRQARLEGNRRGRVRQG
jgi:hypothetical protein